MYRSTKTFGHEVGLSVAFRQHRADSHCRYLHGYALAVYLEFEANELDARGWVIDFGGLSEVRDMLKHAFDHKLCVAWDDPQKDDLGALAGLGVADVVMMHGVGCEAFAQYIFNEVARWLANNGHTPRVELVKVEVREHGANSAIYSRGRGA